MAKNGGKNGPSRAVDQLVAMGFGKAKATQALKDAGNNVDVAARILERQRDLQSAKEAKSVAAHKQPAASALPQQHAGSPPAQAAAATEKRVPLHPCIVQYKSCQFGDYCRLRHLPGDTCINYYNGSCIYGDQCRRRHYVDGVDLREGQRYEISDTFTREDGTKYRIVTTGSGSNPVQIAEVVPSTGEDAADDDARGVLQGRVVYVPDPADFNLVRGSEPTHTDPYAHPCLARSSDADVPSSQLPRPFFEKLVSAAPEGNSVTAPSHPPVVVGSNGSATRVAQDASPLSGKVRVKKHPCVAQFGSCKYGATCEHVDRDADVCVHFLNGRCKFSADECHYRHETAEEYAAKLLEKRDERAMPSPSSPPPPAAKKKKNRLQGAYPDGPMSSSAASGHRAHSPLGGSDGSGPTSVRGFSVNPSYEELTDGTAAWEVVGTDGAGSAGARHSAAVMAADFFPAPASAGDEGVYSDSNDGAADSPSGPLLRDSELATFLGLLEAFPQEEPAFILQALRSAGGDPAAVADLVGRVEGATAADIDAELARALAEEEAAEAETDRASRELVAKSETFLTLCHLFPALELNSIEAVYHSRNENFEETYEALLCSKENITRRDYGNVWRGNVNPAEQLRLEKVMAMFPEIHPDIVRSTFGSADKDSKRTVAALNQLSSELLSLRTRIDMGTEAMRWRPHAATGPQRPGQPSTSRRPTYSVLGEVATEADDVEALYKTAEAELRELGDWRRVRLRAYGVNTCRLRVLSQASAAYLRGEGGLAKALSREGHALGAEYERLNRLAMLALEMERLRGDPASTLDLHGFHATEALEVLTRRVELCRRKRIRFLSIVVGEGHHSRRGQGTLARAVTDFVETDPRMRSALQLVSVKPGCLLARVTFSTER